MSPMAKKSEELQPHKLSRLKERHSAEMPRLVTRRYHQLCMTSLDQSSRFVARLRAYPWSVVCSIFLLWKRLRTGSCLYIAAPNVPRLTGARHLPPDGCGFGGKICRHLSRCSSSGSVGAVTILRSLWLASSC